MMAIENVYERTGSDSPAVGRAKGGTRRSAARRGDRRVRVSVAAAKLDSLVHLVPVDRVPPGVQVVRALVLVLEVVGVLPHVDPEDRLVAFHPGAVLVRGGAD